MSVIRKTMSQPEALRVYIEMLARAHLEGGFIDQCADVASGRARGSSSPSKSRLSQSSSSSSSGLGGGGGGSQQHGQGDNLCVSVEKAREYLAAARQVENVICTSRESLLGSSAWKQEFLAQLKTRPFYYVTDLPQYCEVHIGSDIHSPCLLFPFSPFASRFLFILTSYCNCIE